MKVTEILAESTVDKVVPQILTDLKGKKMDWKELNAFLATQTNFLETPHVNQTSYIIKADSGLKRGPLMTALKKVADDTCRVANGTKGNAFIVDFNFDTPVKGKILFDQTSDKEQIAKNTQSALKKSKVSGGAKGYFLRNNGTGIPQYNAIGVFTEGPMEGEPFNVEISGKATFKKGDIVSVTHEPTYGKVYLAKK